MIAKWYASVLVLMYRNRQSGVIYTWVGEQVVGCEHIQVLQSNHCFENTWGWQEDKRSAPILEAHNCSTMYMVSLDIKTAFDVARPEVIGKVLQGDRGVWCLDCGDVVRDTKPFGVLQISMHGKLMSSVPGVDAPTFCLKLGPKPCSCQQFPEAI